MNAPAKMKYRVRKRDGLPKLVPADEWVQFAVDELGRKHAGSPSQTVRVGGMIVHDSVVKIAAMVSGALVAVPLNETARLEALCTQVERDFIVECRRRWAAGELNRPIMALIAEAEGV